MVKHYSVRSNVVLSYIQLVTLFIYFLISY